jgi:SulP family sulfate permease
MRQQAATLFSVPTGLGTVFGYFARPIHILRGYQPSYLRDDLIGGATVGLILLPQGLVFAVMAGLPAEMGLYAAIVGTTIAALWGSSNHLHSGPTNTSALLVLATVLPLVAMGSPEYIAATGLLTLMVGIIRLLMGLLRLGLLVNFVSESVVIGFTAGSGILIVVTQLRTLLRLQFPDSPRLPQTVANLAQHLSELHWPSLFLGLLAIGFTLLLTRLNRRLPAQILAIALTTVVAVLAPFTRDIVTIGPVRGGLPRPSVPPLFNFELVSELFVGAVAVAAIGLVEATSIARSLAAQSGQRLDSNQEFVGQGLANIAAGFLSGFVCSGSFNRSAALYRSGGRTAVASAFSGLTVLVLSTILAPFMVWVPRSALAGLLILNAISIIDHRRMRRVFTASRAEAAIMVVTLVGTLLFPLQYAILGGILISLAYYLLRTSTPQVVSVLPDDEFRHFLYRPDRRPCPQLAVIEIRGDLYFGAVNHVEEAILRHRRAHPGQLFLLLRMQAVHQIDISGIYMLEHVVKTYRETNGDVFLIKVRPEVRALMEASHFDRFLGPDHFLPEDEAIAHLFYHVLDPAICIYECEVRAFKECQNLPKPMLPLTLAPISLPAVSVPEIAPESLYRELRGPAPPLVVDVREPREFRQGRVPGAVNVPLPRLVEDAQAVPKDRPIVLACRTGRRSRRAAAHLLQHGYRDLRILAGGMVAWRAAALLEAVDEFPFG